MEEENGKKSPSSILFNFLFLGSMFCSGETIPTPGGDCNDEEDNSGTEIVGD